MRNSPVDWSTVLFKFSFARTRKGKRTKSKGGRRNHLARPLRIELLEDRQLLATVNTTIDINDPNDGLTTLREAIAATLDGGMVDFSTNPSHGLDGATITLDRINLGQIEFGKTLTIDASMLPIGLTIDGGDTTTTFGDGIRLFNITDPITGPDAPHVTFIGPQVGLTFKGGDPNSSSQSGQGGAIRSAAFLTLQNVCFIENDARQGGAIYIQVADGNSTTQRNVLTIEDSVIQNNRSQLGIGGGIAIVSGTFGSPTLDKFLIKRTTISGNDSNLTSGRGGGIHATIHGAELTIEEDSTIAQNKARFGGGVYAIVSTSGSVTVRDSILDDNEGANNASGAGIYAEVNSQSLLRIEGTTLKANTALGGNGGGAFALVNNASVEIVNSFFIEQNVASNGGGFAASASNGSSVTLDRVTVDGNESATGGGIHLIGGGESHLRIEKSTISGNTASVDGGGLLSSLSQNSSLTVTDSDVSGNMAERDGGGILARAFGYASGAFPMPRSITISRCLISGNTAFERGGGLYTLNRNGGTETLVEDSRISGNHVITPESYYGNGGGVYAYLFGNASESAIKPRFTITRSTVDDNDTLNMGGGVFVCIKSNGVFNATNSTLSGNSTRNQVNGAGGGIFIARPNFTTTLDAYLRNVTVTQNESKTGGGVGIVTNRPDVFVRIANSIISENFNHSGADNNLHGRVDIANSKFNLVGSGSIILDTAGNPASLDITNLTNDDPGLYELGEYGGPTPTHRLKPGSLAIDAGSNDYAKDPLAEPPDDLLETDQRGIGFLRKFDYPGEGAVPGEVVDIGAYEISLAQVIDVQLHNPTVWAREPYSYAELVPAGKQLAPIYTEDVTTIIIRFSEDVVVDEDALLLYGSNVQGTTTALQIGHTIGGFSAYNSATSSASWTFDPLLGDKYRIDLNAALVNSVGGLLDGDWTHLTNGTLDDWTDDNPEGMTFDELSGNGTASGSFQFFFALLPGDYNQDGIVNEADDVVLKDGNGDNVDGGPGDQSVRGAHGGDRLEYHHSDRADYYDDDIINAKDYMVWVAMYGATGVEPGSPGDGTWDGNVNAADYLTWANWKNSRSAWYVPSMGLGSLMAIEDSGGAPTVMNVTISGSSSMHDSYSFDSHDGSGEQLRTVPVGGADTISITFSEDVNVVASNLRLVGLRTANVPTLVEFTYDVFTMTATWRFDDLIANDHYLISLSDAVTDIQGNRLDGEWVNPVSLTTTNALVSEFPSGDGAAGGHFNFVMTLLAGDVDRNNYESPEDIDVIWTNWGLSGPGVGWTDGDVSGDQVVDAPDSEIADANMSQGIWLYLDTTWLLSDLNGDFVINDSDANILANNLGMSNPTWADGDLDGDGDIDAADADLLFTQYGLEFAVAS